MSDIIDVLIAFDTETIIQTYRTPSQDPNNPTPVTPNLIYMMVRQGNALSGQAGGELNVKAQIDDVIRWRETTLSLSADSNAILYKYTPWIGGDLISPAVVRISHPTVPIPNPNDPLHPTTQQITSHYWTSDVLDQGRVIYSFRFFIMDRNEKVIGYYYWDPYVTIRP
jgi:nematocidal protein AidA